MNGKIAPRDFSINRLRKSILFQIYCDAFVTMGMYSLTKGEDMLTHKTLFSFVLVAILAVGCGGATQPSAQSPTALPAPPTAVPSSATAAPPTLVPPTSSPIAVSFELVSIIKADPQLSSPTGIAVDKQGNLYVLDAGNSRVVKFDSAGKQLTAWGTRGEDDGQFNIDFSGGGRIAVDGQGNVYVTGSNYRVQKFDGNGKFLTKWGSRGDGEGQFSPRVAVAVDTRGNVYTSEFENNRVEKFDSNGNLIFKLGGKGTSDVDLITPVGVTVDQNDNIYVGELSGRVQGFNSNGKAIAEFYPSQVASKVIRPIGLTVDVQGNLYITDHRYALMAKLDNSGNLIGAWEDPRTSNSLLTEPWGVAVDAQGNIYISDSANDRIQKFRQK